MRATLKILITHTVRKIIVTYQIQNISPLIMSITSDTLAIKDTRLINVMFYK